MNRDEFLSRGLRNPVNEIIADELFALALPDAWLVSGCLVQTVWNVLTGRAVDYGISDYDVFYFDPDTSWEAEDAVIRNAGRTRSNGSASPSKCATRRGFISGIAKNTACPTRRCTARPRASTASSPETPHRHPPHAGRLRRLRAGWF